jgi:hypothetical protein
VTVPAGGSASVNVTLTAPTAPSRSTYGGYLMATPQGDGLALRVPYVGVVDYQAENAHLPAAMLRLSGGKFTGVTDGAVFNLTSGEQPLVLFLLDHPARTLSAESLRGSGRRRWSAREGLAPNIQGRLPGRTRSTSSPSMARLRTAICSIRCRPVATWSS